MAPSLLYLRRLPFSLGGRRNPLEGIFAWQASADTLQRLWAHPMGSCRTCAGHLMAYSIATPVEGLSGRRLPRWDAQSASCYNAAYP